jgi:hypothetical protein
MRPIRIVCLAFVLGGWCCHAAGFAGEFRPDPRSVLRCGPAYRYPQAGWTVLHIEGEPYERGLQHGHLLAPEIAAHVHCLATYYSPKAPADNWKRIRELVNALFLRGYTREQLEEMKGIADGASASGARIEGRAIDLVDIAVINAPNELESLDDALLATPTGLEGLTLAPDAKPAAAGQEAAQRDSLPEQFAQSSRRRPIRCSAFAATGPATKDGKIVLGHITMWELYPASFYNVWLEIKPRAGHRFVMQTYPGGMHSGMDYLINDAGIVMCETNLDQTRFESSGKPLAARIRQAAQYAESIDKTVELLTQESNGLSTEEWILGDLKTNEIALLTHGTRRNSLRRSGKQEWVAGAAGFYWSCNNNKDRAARLETVASLEDRPSDAGAFAPSTRDVTWLRMYDRHQGKIDADFARQALTMPPLVTASSVDAKYTTSDLAAKLQSWASFGPPTGSGWQPTESELQRFPDVRPLVSNPWTLLDSAPPAEAESQPIAIVDLHDWRQSELSVPSKGDADPRTRAAWHGTLLPKTDADIWLTTGFANYERIVALERALERKAKHGLTSADQERLAVSLFEYRASYELGARAGVDTPLDQIKANPRDDHWSQLAVGKGVLLLHSLRELVGHAEFDKLMDQFGRANAGREVTAAEFRTHVEKVTGKSWSSFFDPWLSRAGLPGVEVGKCEARRVGAKWNAIVTLRRDKAGPILTVPLIVEGGGNETVTLARLEKEEQTVEVMTDDRPERVVVDKFALAPHARGASFSILSYEDELDKSLIIYGSLDEEAANREAATLWRRALKSRDQATDVEIRKDSDVTDDDARTHHLLLIGRPDSNRLLARFRDALPVSFGSRSFVVRGEGYAHPESALLMAAENPLNRRFSLVVGAGLSALATQRAVTHFGAESLNDAEVVVLQHNDDERPLVLPPKALIRDFESSEKPARSTKAATR